LIKIVSGCYYSRVLLLSSFLSFFYKIKREKKEVSVNSNKIQTFFEKNLKKLLQK